MRIISLKLLREFWETHPECKQSLTDWYNLLKKNNFHNLMELQQTFSDVEAIGKQRYVFNIKGNHYRIVCVIQFGHQTVYIRKVLTHSEYDKLCRSGKKKSSTDKTLFDI